MFRVVECGLPESVLAGRASEGAAVRRMLAHAVVDSLRFSGDTAEHLRELKNFHHREWEHTLPWLHDAGLALYFLQKLRQADATDSVPPPVLLRLEHNLTANKARVAFMSQQFNSLNQKFDAIGVKYAAVKGFALVPEFCPDASLRHQSDCDYLVDDESLSTATHIVEEAGYFLKKHTPRESVFVMPSARIPAYRDQQYDADTAHAIELLRYMWDRNLYDARVAEPRFSLENSRINHCQGVPFRTLSVEDAFLIQVTHAFNHILTCWIRMSWLCEIAYFLNQRAFDPLFWGRIEDRLGDKPVQREITVVVTALAAQFFGAPLPPAVWSRAQELRPAVRIWIENYARKWAFGKNQPHELGLFPTAKLVLFLHREYAFDTATRRRLTRAQLLPLKQLAKRLRRTAASLTGAPATVQESPWQLSKKILLRISFHATSGLRYLSEIPRWWWLNRVENSTD